MIFLLLVGSTKTNLVFVFVFTTLDIGVFLLVGAFFKVAAGEDTLAGRLQKVCLSVGDGVDSGRRVDRSFLLRRLVCCICFSLSRWRS